MSQGVLHTTEVEPPVEPEPEPRWRPPEPEAPKRGRRKAAAPSETPASTDAPAPSDVAPGAADRSYGIHVAARAGIPAAVLDRARSLLRELETRHAQAPATEGATIQKPKLVQASLFAGTSDPILTEIAGLDPAGVSAEAALGLLQRWKKELGG